jgi:hypothetical protein
MSPSIPKEIQKKKRGKKRKGEESGLHYNIFVVDEQKYVLFAWEMVAFVINFTICSSKNFEERITLKSVRSTEQSLS